MRRRDFDLIAFDGDDTLWHNERSFREGRDQFRRLLSRAGVVLSSEEIDVCVNRIEEANLQYYGYGVSSFVLSLVETAIDLTDGQISGRDLRDLIDLAKHMLTEEIEVFPGAHEALTTLARSSPLMLITKGDLLHQRSKLDRSGLAGCFRFIEVVSHKTADVYTSILSRHDISADRFLMVGNSLRSDILPVVEAGGSAVYIPAAVSWSHEHADVPAHAHGRYVEVPTLEQLPDAIRTLVKTSPSPRVAPASGRRRPAAGNRRS
ncbi:MAG TPA: HAD family hydrolase [Thermoanaerobaculia bacterium]|nr:HAD family hydrolase [Thermoanaerobaculia bacterium]